MVCLADPDPVDGRSQIGTRMTFKQHAKLVYGHTATTAQNPRLSADSARIMQGFASFMKAAEAPLQARSCSSDGSARAM
jgi:hypothetical protein